LLDQKKMEVWLAPARSRQKKQKEWAEKITDEPEGGASKKKTLEEGTRRAWGWKANTQPYGEWPKPICLTEKMGETETKKKKRRQSVTCAGRKEKRTPFPARRTNKRSLPTHKPAKR